MAGYLVWNDLLHEKICDDEAVTKGCFSEVVAHKANDIMRALEVAMTQPEYLSKEGTVLLEQIGGLMRTFVLVRLYPRGLGHKDYDLYNFYRFDESICDFALGPRDTRIGDVLIPLSAPDWEDSSWEKLPIEAALWEHRERMLCIRPDSQLQPYRIMRDKMLGGIPPRSMHTHPFRYRVPLFSDEHGETYHS